LKNFGVPYFVVIAKIEDPNLWWKHARDFKLWLQSEAKNAKGEILAISTSNSVINSVNHFLKWMRDSLLIEWENYRPFEAINARKKNQRSEVDLITRIEQAKISAKMHALSPLLGDMFDMQAEGGFRINELVGLPFDALHDTVPDYLAKNFRKLKLTPVGSIYLNSQPSLKRVRIYGGEVPRKPLKWRNDMSDKSARTIPIFSKKIWNMLIDRYESASQKYTEELYGLNRQNYLLFEGASVKDYLAALRLVYLSLNLAPRGSHILRHTLTTDWVELGLPQKICEITLGHKTASHEKYNLIVGKINSQRNKNADIKKFSKK
jgi:integrase